MQTSIYWHYAVYATAGQHDRHPPSRARKQAGHACRLWASVLVPFCSLPTLTRLWHWPACGEALSPPHWLQQHPGCTLTTRVEKTSLLHLHSPRGGSSAIGAREAKRARDGGREQREGEVSSTPLRRCDRTSPARKRVSFSHITQEVCCSTLHLLGLYLTYQRSGTVETWCYHTTG